MRLSSCAVGSRRAAPLIVGGLNPMMLFCLWRDVITWECGLAVWEIFGRLGYLLVGVWANGRTVKLVAFSLFLSLIEPVLKTLSRY